MFDEVCEQLCMRTAKGEWTSLEELSGMAKRHSLDEKDVEHIMNFLKKYFLEVDESERKARLNSWSYALFQIL